MKKTLGGDRLGSGKKMDVELHNYERSTHDLGYIWRSTMSSGTLVPFISEVALPGDTFDIHLECDIKTHPTIGPLFGSYKVQLDVFQAPMRLYNAYLHNNKLNIGRNMNKIFLPQIELEARSIPPEIDASTQLENSQINPSCILSYLGIRGIGYIGGTGDTANRQFNGLPWLAYWEIYKNYYANKQEEIGAVIHSPMIVPTIDIISFVFNGGNITQAPVDSSQFLFSGSTEIQIVFDETIGVTATRQWLLNNIILYMGTGQTNGQALSFYLQSSSLSTTTLPNDTLTIITKPMGSYFVYSWDWSTNYQPQAGEPNVFTFNLNDIDTMRDTILSTQNLAGPFVINNMAALFNINPYKLINRVSTLNPLIQSQEGLAVKTYQSDLFNNWLSTEWIDGVDGITEITAIDTSGGSFTIDTLNLSKKVYLMLNRIAVSGGSYNDWIDAVYTHERFRMAESPIYHGGLIKELVFQEVVSNSGTSGDTGSQPLGTLAGKGVMSNKNKGGNMIIRVDEPSYIIGLISLTPRIDFSQGNKWDSHLLTMDDLHKPQLDEIGFQELITEQMAWMDTTWDTVANKWVTKSAGKQPAWINYMTNVNQTRGNFAIPDNEMFMTLNRRYEYDRTTEAITDVTTYIDPAKFNFIFADTQTDAQNFWSQIAVDITARRKMSAKIMPNL